MLQQVCKKLALTSKIWNPSRNGRGYKFFFTFLDTLDEVKKCHKVSAKLVKGVKTYSTLNVRRENLSSSVLMGSKDRRSNVK